MRYAITFAIISLISLCHSCQRELPPQSVAGYIDAASNEQRIVVNAIDSATVTLATPRTMVFAIDDNTTYESSGIAEGNIVEVVFQPSEEGTTPTAIAIYTDDTYPRALGRWSNNEQNRLRIDIELMPSGKIRQHLPTQTVQFTRWQLTEKENIITLSGEVSLPPAYDNKAKGKKSATSTKKQNEEQEVTPPARRQMEFTTTATIGYEGDRRTITIESDKKQHSVLYRIE